MTRLILAIAVGWFLASLVTACAYAAARWYTRHTPPPPPSSVVLAPCPHCGHPEALADRGPPRVPVVHDGVGVAGGGGVKADWAKHAHWLPRPWSNYMRCHGDPRRCYWYPRWRDAIACRLLGHDWYPVWFDDGQPEVMCRRCAGGPTDLAEATP